MGRSERPHKPRLLGPRVYTNHNGDVCLDLRPWGGGRVTARNPASPGWPRRGRKAESEEEAAPWGWRYVERIEGKARGSNAPRLKDAVGRYLAHRKEHQAANTVKNDRTSLRHLLALAKNPNIPLDGITTETLQRWVDERSAEGYAALTLRDYARAWGGFFAWAGLGEIVDAVKTPDLGTRDVKVWSDEELSTIREACETETETLLVEASVCTGARESELWALQWSDFSPTSRSVRIERQLHQRANNPAPTKSGRGRTALVLPEFWDLYRPAVGRLFPLRAPSTRRRVLSGVLDRAGLNAPGVLFHSFRHTYSRLILERKGSLEQLRVFLGHATIKTTEEYYGHFADEAALRLGREALYGSGTGTGTR